MLELPEHICWFRASDLVLLKN